jgi:Holliday junction resolvasome RuvABC endonuclease subunit
MVWQRVRSAVVRYYLTAIHVTSRSAHLRLCVRIVVRRTNSLRMPKCFLGIDPSLSGSGLSVISSDYKLLDTTKFTTKSFGAERLYLLELKLLEFLDRHSDIVHCCIEGPAMREEGRVHDLSQWAGIIYLTLYKRGVPFLTPAPSQLKKYASSSGENQGKGVVMLDVFKNFGEEFRDNDICDAYVMSRISRDYHLLVYEKGDVSHLKKYQMEVLKKLVESEKKKHKDTML